MVSALAVSSLRMRAYDSAFWVLAAASDADFRYRQGFESSDDARFLGQDPGSFPAEAGALASRASEERQGVVRNRQKL